jgi:hypothetical protein
MINSAEGFPVDIVYATPVDAIRELGTVAGRLPRPDMVVTHSRWDVFLPAGPRYRTPDSTMDLVLDGIAVNPRTAGADVLARAAEAYQSQIGQPLRVSVPTQGIRFTFEKLYANQSPEGATFSIGYLSADANGVAVFLSVVGVILIWAGIAALADPRVPLSRRAAAASIAGGIALVLLTVGYSETSPVPAAALALAIATGLGAWAGVERWRDWHTETPVGPVAT